MGEDFGQALVERASALRRTARALVRRVPGLWEGRDLDDVLSLLQEHLWEMWASNDEEVPEDWRHQLWLKGRATVARWADGSAATGGMTGVSGQRRRLRAAMAVEDEWRVAHGGRLPTRSQLARWWEDLGGGMIDEMHFNSPAPLPDPDEDLPDWHRQGCPMDDMDDLAETRQVLKALIVQATKVSPRLGQFAAWWLQAVVAGKDPQLAEVAVATGLPVGTARRYACAVRAVAMGVLADQFGIAPIAH